MTAAEQARATADLRDDCRKTLVAMLDAIETANPWKLRCIAGYLGRCAAVLRDSPRDPVTETPCKPSRT